MSAEKRTGIVFASVCPIERPHATSKELSVILREGAYFGDIVMSFVFTTGNSSAFFSYGGVFRNPLHFLDIQERYKGIVMKLQGFAALVAQTRFEGKKYMVTDPLATMTEIMCKSLGAGNVYMGDNLELDMIEGAEDTDGSAELKKKQLMQAYPPRLHFSHGTTKIAAEGIDLCEYLEELPDEKAEWKSESTVQDFLPSPALEGLLLLTTAEKLTRCYVDG